MKARAVKVLRYEYRNGIVAWRVSGTINGERFRKNFKTRAEAVAEKQVQEIKRNNSAQDLKTIATRLTPEQTREAERVFHRLKGNRRSLTFAMDYFLEYYREPETEKTLSEAIRDYLDARSLDEGNGIIGLPTFKGIKKEMGRFERAFPGVLLGEITAVDITRLLQGETKSLKTWNNRRGQLSAFFKYAHEQRWRNDIPVEGVKHHRITRQRGTAETLTAEDARKLMEFVETYDGLTDRQRKAGATGRAGILAPYCALCLFAGVRPDWLQGEIGKLQPEQIDLRTGVIRIEPNVSKVNEKRTIQIQPNLALWLKRYPIPKYPIIPEGMRRVHRVSRKKFGIGHDVLRHTYISMLVGKFRSLGDAGLQAGNSEAVIRKFYLDVKSKEEAGEFWNICPAPIGGEKVVQFRG